MNKRSLIVILAGVSLTLGPASARADDETDPDTTRLQQSGEIISKDELVKRIHAQHSGKIVETELQRAGKGCVYRVQLMDSDGTKQELRVDAKTGDSIAADSADDDN
jgi:uncharacterized membrane protein YkoI